MELVGGCDKGRKRNTAHDKEASLKQALLPFLSANLFVTVLYLFVKNVYNNSLLRDNALVIVLSLLQQAYGFLICGIEPMPFHNFLLRLFEQGIAILTIDQVTCQCPALCLRKAKKGVADRHINDWR